MEEKEAVKEGDARETLKHIHALLREREVPPVPEHLLDDPFVREIHDDLLELRRTLMAYAGGDFSKTFAGRGFVGGTLKALQAAMRHLTWQIQRVAEGDFIQRVEFLGDFSTAFNEMIRQLEESVSALKRKEAELTRLTRSLTHEVEMRTVAMRALSRSEANFKYLAGHDPLTETLNRRAFLETALVEAQAAAVAGLSCGIALLDVDHFKRFNDTHGHQAGDEALRTLVKVAGDALRASDIMGRFGGEEFVFFFPGAGITPAIAACERIRKAIAAHPVVWKELEIPVTVSIGVTEIPADTTEPRDDIFLQQYISTADKALYRAKAAGRNRVVAMDCEDFYCNMPQWNGTAPEK